jgi:hypothetical protein
MRQMDVRVLVRVLTLMRQVRQMTQMSQVHQTNTPYVLSA